jgi:hypothetical protein
MVVTKTLSAPVISGVTVTFTAQEAMQLRRVCYYNKTVAHKYAGNPVGGSDKAEAIDSFLNTLGSTLKANGIERF